MVKRVREGYWFCSKCDFAKEHKIPGGTHVCPTCGGAWNPTLYPTEKVIFDHSDPSSIVTDAAKIRASEAGPSWNCGKCGFSNPGNAATCGGPTDTDNPDGTPKVCGQPRSGDDMVNPVVVYYEGKSADGIELDTREDLRDDATDRALNGWGDKLYAGVESEAYESPVRHLPASEMPTEAPSQYGSSDDTTEPTDDELAHRGSWVWGNRFPQTRERQPGKREDLLVIMAPFIRPIIISLAGLAVLIFLIIGGKYVYDNYIATTEVDTTVTSLTWVRTIEVEEFKTFYGEEGWDIPPGGRYVSQREKWHHDEQVVDYYREWDEPVYDDVPDGEEQYVCGTEYHDNGNGYETEVDKYCTRTKYKRVIVRYDHKREPVYRSEPVYRTWYTYDIDRWVVARYDTARGDSTTEPTWPASTARGPKERAGSSTEVYTAVLKDAQGRTKQYQLDFDSWNRLEIGTVVKVDQTRQGVFVNAHWPQGLVTTLR